MTPTIETSTGFIRTSLAAAMTMKLKTGRFFRDAHLHCLNLLLVYPDGCKAACTYCGLSRNVDSENGQSFIRVEWPTYSVDEIIAGVRAHGTDFQRACISMVMHPRSVEDTIELTGRLRRETGLPVSVLLNPSTLNTEDMEKFLKAGADRATVAIDAATPELFDRHRGRFVNGPHRWNNYWNTLEEASLVFGIEGIGAHLIAGLGETESEMVASIQRVKDLGGTTHLFSFYPEPGSALEKAQACPAGQFRRIQLARFLIDFNIADGRQMDFDDLGRLTGFGVEISHLDDIVATGEPFTTSGCPGKTLSCACNRPFGDGPPGDIRSYPFQLEPRDIQLVRTQMATYAPLTAPLAAQY